MNRLQKKCFIASGGFHLLLLLILVVGPAFFSGNQKQDTQVLTFFDLPKVTDGPTTGGGNPNVEPPAAREATQPPPPAPPQPTVKPRDPAPDRNVEKEIKSTEKTPFADKPQKKPQISTQIVKPGANTKPTNNSTKTTQTEAQKEATRIAAEFQSAVKGLSKSLSKSTAFEMPGTGGQASVNWAQAVVSIYYDAWIPPDGLDTNEEVNTKVSVTVAADGDVISARITKASGNASADDSVQRTLNRVRTAAPIPASSKDKQRTIIIIFNPAVKKQAG